MAPEPRRPDCGNKFTVPCGQCTRCRVDKAAEIIGAMGLEIMHFPSKGLLMHEIGRRGGPDDLSLAEFEEATTRIPPPRMSKVREL